MIDFSELGGKKFNTILADPPWMFKCRNGKASPENDKCFHYHTMELKDIKLMEVGKLANNNAYLYLWIPACMLDDGIDVLRAWGFKYRNCVIWRKITKKGSTSLEGLGFPFRNSHEMLIVGHKGNLKKVSFNKGSVGNIISARTREHSRKPDETYDLIEHVSQGDYLELFARTHREGWTSWGNEVGKF